MPDAPSAAPPFFRRDVEPQGLQPQDNNDKPTRPFSSLLESQTDHVLQLSPSRSRKGEGEAAEGGETFFSTGAERKCEIRLCPLQQLPHYHTLPRHSLFHFRQMCAHLQ